MSEDLYRIEQQADGTFTAFLLDGGYLETVAECPTYKDAENSARYCLAKNREYREEM